MPPSKRSSTKTSAGTAPTAKRGRSSAATSVAISDSVTLPASDATSSSSSGTVSIDVAALSPQCLPWYQKPLRPPSRPKP